MGELSRGTRYGKWVIIREQQPGQGYRVTCRCDCGTERRVWVSSLTRGMSRSCGACGNRGSKPTHPRPASPTQARALWFISEFQLKHGRSPSRDEIGEHFGARANAVAQWLLGLERKGYLRSELLILRIPESEEPES